MPLLNRLLGALRGASNPGHPGGARPAGARPVGAGGHGARTGGLAGILGSLLGGRGRRRGL